MSSADRQRIIAAIIAAAHGDGVIRETHIDDDLDANEPAPDFHVSEELDGGDEYSFYGEADEEGYDCYGEHVDEDDVDDPWGYTFPELSTGASRAALARHKGIIINGAQEKGIIINGVPSGIKQGFDPQPDPPKGYVGAPLMVKKASPIQQHPAAKKAAPAKAAPKPAAKTSKPSAFDMAALKAFKFQAPKAPKAIPPMPKPVAPPDAYADENYYEIAPDYDYEGQQEPDVDAYADGEASTLDYEDEDGEYDDGGYSEFSGEDYGYGYGDFGSEEDYPHDGSTYGWEDCW